MAGMTDLTALLLALPITIENLKDHIGSGEVPPHEAQRLVDLAEAALGYLHDYVRQQAGL
jgi:hypothetical protein